MKKRQFDDCESCLWDEVCTEYVTELDASLFDEDEDCDDYYTGLENGRDQYRADLTMRQGYYDRCVKDMMGTAEIDFALDRTLREFGL